MLILIWILRKTVNRSHVTHDSLLQHRYAKFTVPTNTKLCVFRLSHINLSITTDSMEALGPMKTSVTMHMLTWCNILHGLNPPPPTLWKPWTPQTLFPVITKNGSVFTCHTHTYLEHRMPNVLSMCQPQKGVASLTNQVLMPPTIRCEKKPSVNSIYQTATIWWCYHKQLTLTFIFLGNSVITVTWMWLTHTHTQNKWESFKIAKFSVLLFKSDFHHKSQRGINSTINIHTLKTIRVHLKCSYTMSWHKWLQGEMSAFCHGTYWQVVSMMHGHTNIKSTSWSLYF